MIERNWLGFRTAINATLLDAVVDLEVINGRLTAMDFRV
jgi:hypothetical protein